MTSNKILHIYSKHFNPSGRITSLEILYQHHQRMQRDYSFGLFKNEANTGRKSKNVEIHERFIAETYLGQPFA